MLCLHPGFNYSTDWWLWNAHSFVEFSCQRDPFFTFYFHFLFSFLWTLLVADLINCKTFMTDTNIGQKPLLWYSAHLNFDIKRHFYVNTLFQLISLSTFVKRYIGKRLFPCHISIAFSLKHTSWNVLVKWGFPVSKKCLVLLIDNLTGSKLKLNFLHILLFYVVSILNISYFIFHISYF